MVSELDYHSSFSISVKKTSKDNQYFFEKFRM